MLVRGGNPRVHLDSAVEKLHCLWCAPGARRDDTHEMQCLRMFGRSLEKRDERALGVAQGASSIQIDAGSVGALKLNGGAEFKLRHDRIVGPASPISLRLRGSRDTCVTDNNSGALQPHARRTVSCHWVQCPRNDSQAIGCNP